MEVPPSSKRTDAVGCDDGQESVRDGIGAAGEREHREVHEGSH